ERLGPVHGGGVGELENLVRRADAELDRQAQAVRDIRALTQHVAGRVERLGAVLQRGDPRLRRVAERPRRVAAELGEPGELRGQGRYPFGALEDHLAVLQRRARELPARYQAERVQAHRGRVLQVVHGEVASQQAADGVAHLRVGQV